MLEDLVGGAELLHQPRDPFAAEQAHQIVFERYEELRRARVSLSTGATSKLPVDSSCLVPLGSEDVKGHEEVREAARILRGADIVAYHGFVEGDDIAKGTVDVVVTDGFTGNIALKTAEGVARFISALLKEALTSSLQAKVGAAIAMPALKAMGRRIDPSAINGGPLLGLNGIVVKSHGGADAKGYANAIRIAVDLARSDYLTKVQDSLGRLSATLELAATAPLTVTEPSQ